MLPPAERLLIVPLGLCAMLPYSAGVDPRGGRLVDHTAITLAPSLAWARAARRPAPEGANVGVFHPGDPPLDLAGDMETFTEHVGGLVAQPPTAEVVLELLRHDTRIGHFSCHGTYDALRPLKSALLLETPLDVRAVIGHGSAPWLVNLSACETAMPDLRAAEQLISFPTAFLLGGAAHVLATLWMAGDIEATEVNRQIYRAVASGAHPGEALRAAVNHRLRPGRDQPGTEASAPHPLWWAPFVHHGSPW